MTPENGIFINPTTFLSREEIMQQLAVPEAKTVFSYERATDFLKDAQSIFKEASLGQSEAVWKPEAQYQDIPLAITLSTDAHYGAIGTDYDLLEEHFKIIENTPNFGVITNGDHVDNFNATGKWASGMFENPLPPQIQTKAFIERIRRIDALKKVGVMSFGNHDNFVNPTGYDWLETFATGMNSPIFTQGGLLHILHGTEHYTVALTHKFWGTSKRNPTNAIKNFVLEFPEADVYFLGHTHQSEAIDFEFGGKEKVGTIGGTYKKDDHWATQVGIGRHPGKPGRTLLLYPHQHRMAIVSIDIAKDFIESKVKNEKL